jgi:hypothetical protein
MPGWKRVEQICTGSVVPGSGTLSRHPSVTTSAGLLLRAVQPRGDELHQGYDGALTRTVVTNVHIAAGETYESHSRELRSAFSVGREHADERLHHVRVDNERTVVGL